MRKTFDDALLDIKARTHIMFQSVRETYKRLFAAIKTHDNQKAQAIIDKDARINDLETSINNDCMLIILKQCPVARDLRFIIATIKIVNDLERIADYAENIAVYLIKSEKDITAQRQTLLAYETTLIAMLEGMMHAYQKHDAACAKQCALKDDAIDALYHEHMHTFIKQAQTLLSHDAYEASRALLMIKQLERAGDHLTNIAEHIVFSIEGKMIDINR